MPLRGVANALCPWLEGTIGARWRCIRQRQEAAINRTQRVDTMIVLGLLFAAGSLFALIRPASPAPSSGPDPARSQLTEGSGTAVEAPKAGWLETAKRVYAEINENRILLVAAGVTFYVLLALFPGIAGMVSLYGLFADPANLSQQLSRLSGLIPSGASDIIGEQVKRVAANGTTTLGMAFLTGLAVAMWSANAGMKAMFDALNIVYGEQEQRSFVRLNVQSLAFTAGSIVFALLAIGAIVVLPILLSLFGSAGRNIGSTFSGVNVIGLVRWPALLGVVLLALAVLYRFGPSRTRPEWRWVTLGSAIASVVWLGSSMLFSWYVSNFGTYNETYGSLGAAIGFMTWLWLSAFIVLAGAQINAEIERQSAVSNPK